MNVTTFVPAQVVRRRFSIPFLSGIFSGSKNLLVYLFSKPRRIFFTVLTLLAAFGLYTIFFSGNSSNEAPNVLGLSQQFEVTAKTKDGRNTNGDISVDVTGTYKAGSLLVQGQRVIARNGKEFLIINMELSNPYNVPLYLQPVDSFRLIGDDDKKYAPTAHQGNVEIRPQSTKTSNVGFVIPKGESKFKVEIVELNSEKVVLEFSL